MRIKVMRGDFREVASDAVVIYQGLTQGTIHSMLESAHRTPNPYEVLRLCARAVSRPLQVVVAPTREPKVDSFQHVVFAINHYLPNVGRDLVYARALQRSSLERFTTLTVPVFYDRDYGVKPRDFALALRTALIGQAESFDNCVAVVNLVAGDPQSMAALTPLFPREYL